jgi:hydrogenase nickel incorporation protein HypA/HybF
MHELSIAQAVVEACAERAAGSLVVRVRLEIGVLSGVLPEAVRFSFDVCARDTVLHGAALEIIERPGRALCRDCGGEVELAGLVGRCGCGSIDLRIIAGEELKIREMELA